MSSSTREAQAWEWDLKPGYYSAKELIREAGTILAAVEIHLGEAADPQSLLDNVQASLAIEGREAVLPLAALGFQDRARAELAKQAQTIGEGIVRQAREYSEQRIALKREGSDNLSRLAFRSRCDSHLWTPQVTALLTGQHGGPVVMQLFNEYLHQLVLLRDILLPFENWEQVLVDIPEQRSRRGLRHLEQAREEFLAELLVKQVPHKSIVKYAQSVLCPPLSDTGYGFRYRQGVVLPSGIGESRTNPPKYLLQWHAPGTIFNDSADYAKPAAILYAEEDYYSAPRSEIGKGKTGSANAGTEQGFSPRAEIAVTAEESGRIQASYRIRFGDEAYDVDLGQISRGYRYSYSGNWNGVSEEREEPRTDRDEGREPRLHDALSVLSLPGLVTHQEGTHIISTGGVHSICWALLGKLYPENVILLREVSEGKESANTSIGKGFGARFLVD